MQSHLSKPMDKMQTTFNNSRKELLDKRFKLSQTIMLGIKELQLHEKMHRETSLELLEKTGTLVEQNKISENEYLEFANFLKDKINYTTTNFQTQPLLNFSARNAETPRMSRFLQEQTLREQRRLECIQQRREIMARERANEVLNSRLARLEMKVRLDELDAQQKAVRNALNHQKHTRAEKKLLGDALKAKQMAEKEKLILKIQLEDMARFDLCMGTGKHSRSKMLVYQDFQTGKIQNFAIVIVIKFNQRSSFFCMLARAERILFFLLFYFFIFICKTKKNEIFFCAQTTTLLHLH